MLDEAFGYVESDGDWDTNTRSVVWTIDRINAGEFADVWVIVRALDYGTFENTAVAYSDENKTDVPGTVNVTVIPNVELEVVKEMITGGEIAVGDYLIYSIYVFNHGLSNATDVVVSDVLDPAFAYDDSDGQWDGETRTVVWTIGQIDAGAFSEVFVIVRALDYDTFENTAVAHSGENKTDVPGSVNVTIIPNVEFEVVKEMITPGEIAVGDNLTFFITVYNRGLSNATNVVVSDVLDEAFGYVESDGDWDTNTRSVVWTIDRINAGEFSDVWVIVRALDYGTFSNTAVAYSDENKTDVPGTVNVTVIPNVELEVVKEAVTTGDINVGDNITYVITVTNNGLSNASNVIITDVLDEALEYVESDKYISHYYGYTHTVVWTIDSLEAGEHAKVYLIVRAIKEGKFTNTASAKSDENATGSDGTEEVLVLPLVDVAISLSVDNENPDMAGIVTINLTVSNNGPSTATGITGKLNRDFLNGLRIISSDSDDIIFREGLLRSESNVLAVNDDGTFEIDHLDAGQSAKAIIRAQIIREGSIVVDGNVSSIEKDSNLSNNYDMISMLVHSVVELSVDKTVDNAKPVIGEIIEYTVTVVNVGPSNATGVNVSEKLPAGLVYISDNGNGTYDAQTGIWQAGAMKVGEAKSLIVTVLVNATGKITNSVNASSVEDNINTNSSRTELTIDARPEGVDLVAIVDASTTKATVGDLVEFTITIGNIGDNNATGVNVLAKLPDGFTYVSDDGYGAYDPETGIWTIGDLPADEVVVLHIVAQATKTGNITFTVTVTANEGILNPELAQNNVTVEVVAPEPKQVENETAVNAEATLMPTGNPLMVLLAALLFVGASLRRRKH